MNSRVRYSFAAAGAILCDSSENAWLAIQMCSKIILFILFIVRLRAEPMDLHLREMSGVRSHTFQTNKTLIVNVSHIYFLILFLMI